MRHPARALLEEDVGELTGRWITDDYEYYTAQDQRLRKATEIIDILHDGERVVATKVTGDPCVPVGFVTFEGVLPERGEVAAVTWTAGTPNAPSSERYPGYLRVIGQDEFRAGNEYWPEMTFRRVRESSVEASASHGSQYGLSGPERPTDFVRENTP